MAGPARSLPRLRLPALPRIRRLTRSLIVGGLILLALCAAYLLWFRNSSFVAVEEVGVRGIEGHPELEQPLVAAARQQSTLNVDVAALERAVASEPAVRGISAEVDFPDRLDLEVDLRSPVGYVRSEGVVVAADGVILEQAKRPPDGLAVVDVNGGERGRGGSVGGEGLALARVLGAAPAALLAEADSIVLDAELGVLVDLGPGIELRFGSKGDAEKKWAAAAAILADRKLEGAAYIDLSVPERAVVGGTAAGA